MKNIDNELNCISYVDSNGDGKTIHMGFYECNLNEVDKLI